MLQFYCYPQHWINGPERRRFQLFCFSIPIHNEDFLGKRRTFFFILLPIIPSASAFNSCMIELSIPDFNETIIENIISLFVSFSNTERREVVFHTQWFIGQYCPERGERVPLPLYSSRLRRERTFIAVLHFHFMTAFYDCIPQTPGKSTRFLTFSKNHRRESKIVLLLLLLLQCAAFHHFLNAQQVTKAAVFDVSVG